MPREVEIGKQKYIILPIEKVVQKNKTFYTGKLTVKEFEQVAALRPVDSKSIENKYENKSLFGNLFKKVNEEVKQVNEEQAFNRPGDYKRAEEITEYLMNNENSLIPNAIIVGAKEKQLDDDIEVSFTTANFSDDDWANSFNSFQGVYIDSNQLYIPLIGEPLIIIDGQHRYLGLIGLPEKIKNEYEIVLSFLIGYKPIEMAEIFYTINYEQKPVDKSLLTHLKNSFLEKITESSIVYEYIKYLNENRDSPLMGKIRFLKGDKGIVSLAFMQTEIQNLVDTQSTYSQKIPIFTEIFADDENRYLVLQNLLEYFKAIEKLLDTDFDKKLWEKPDSVFTKSIGIGAFLQILPSLIIKILIDKGTVKNHLSIVDLTLDDYYSALQPLTAVRLNEYEKGGGLGLLGKLKKEMEKLLGIKHIVKTFIVDEQEISWISKHYIKKSSK